jgi:hypothetical protein
MQSLAGLRNIEAVDRQWPRRPSIRPDVPPIAAVANTRPVAARSDHRRRAKIASVVNLKRKNPIENPIRVYQ